jgi:hypothetical protein
LPILDTVEVYRFLYHTVDGDNSVVSPNKSLLQKLSKGSLKSRRVDSVNKRKWRVVSVLASLLADEGELAIQDTLENY